MDKKHSSQLYFIIGMDRSGTTILTKLLNNFVDIHCLPEANFLLFFLHQFKNKKNFTKEDIALIFEQMRVYYLTHPWIGWEFNFEACENVIKEASLIKQITYQELCKIILENFKMIGINKENSKLLIDKNPSYTLFVNKISAAFVNAKFIWIIRDYRANILSRIQHPNLKSSNIPFNATRWVLYNKEALNFYNTNKEKTLLIKYEELVLNYETEIQKIIQFLNISPVLESDYLEKGLIDFSKYQVPFEHQARYEKKYTDLNQPLNSKRLDAWKMQLSEKEIKICDIICSSFAAKIGYHPYQKFKKIDTFLLKIKHIYPIINGYLDIYKDKLIYFVSVKIKLSKLKSRYTKLGFIKE